MTLSPPPMENNTMTLFIIVVLLLLIGIGIFVRGAVFKSRGRLHHHDATDRLPLRPHRHRLGRELAALADLLAVRLLSLRQG
jgi:hypothetical protein